jgi:DNA-binding transcriptional LysR family regulator
MANFRGLEALRAFVETGSVSQAAFKLGRTQPQVGRLLAALEDELGFALFERKSRRLSLTEEGRAYFEHVQRVLAGHDSLNRFAARLRLGARDHVRVLTAPYVTQAIVADALATLAARIPTFSATIDSRIRIDIETWLGQENFDLGVTVLPISHPGFETEEFLRVQTVVAMMPDDPLSTHPVVTMADLAGARLITTHPRSLVQQQLEHQAREQGLELGSRFETANGMIASQLAARGLGCCVADPFVALSSGTPDLIFRPLEPAIELRYGFVFPTWRPRSRAVSALAREIALEARNKLNGIMETSMTRDAGTDGGTA